MIKAIIFDCFGVLVTDFYRGVIHEFTRTHPEDDVALHNILKAVDRKDLTEMEAILRFSKILGIDSDRLAQAGEKGEVRNDDMIKLVKSLKPQFKLALMSNIRSRDSLDRRFHPGELDELFDVVIASGDVGFIKPEHQIYELTVQKLGVLPSECVMIDDVREYCAGAEALGMQAIQFQTTDQAIRDLRALIDTQP